MLPDQQCAAFRARYAEVALDGERLWALCDDAVAFHIAGNHPFSGSYVGRPAVRDYLDAMRRALGGDSRFTVTSVLSEPEQDLVLVEGTATSGDPAFVRGMVHVLRYVDGLLREFWDYPFDQQAEDAFWSAQVRTVSGVPAPRVPAQRRPDVRVGVPPLR